MKNETILLPWPDVPLSHRIPRYQSLWIGGFSQKQHYYDLNGARHRTPAMMINMDDMVNYMIHCILHIQFFLFSHCDIAVFTNLCIYIYSIYTRMLPFMFKLAVIKNKGSNNCVCERV